MSFGQNNLFQGGTVHDNQWSSYNRNSFNKRNMNTNRSNNYKHNWHHHNFHDFSGKCRDHDTRNSNYVKPHNGAPSLKRRKFSAGTWGDSLRHHPQPNLYEGSAGTRGEPPDYNNSIPLPTRSIAKASMPTTGKHNHSKLDDDEPAYMSRDEIERCSPSRKDGIDALREMHLRYSYCAFIQNLGLRLLLPQTTIGTAMVLCHRFFVRHSHACHDRLLIATAALFLAAKSEETPQPLNNVVRASCEIFHKQDMNLLSYLLPVNWFEQYRKRVIEAEQMILTTLNFELNVEHPYAPLTSVLDKLGLSQTVLVTMALNLVSEGLRSSLWLQFKPHHIAAGAAYLAAKFLNFDISWYEHILLEFRTPPTILQDVAQQLMELFY